jgi:hypothetical protein
MEGRMEGSKEERKEDERERKERCIFFLSGNSFYTFAHTLELCHNLSFKLFFSFLKVLLGQGFIFLPHLIHDVTEVHTWNSIYLHIDGVAQLPA